MFRLCLPAAESAAEIATTREQSAASPVPTPAD
jgi:hypothetical protein